MTAINHLPQEDRTNGWSAVLPKRQPAPALDRTIEADWVVVGAGYAGLAAARRLAENRPGDRIVLVDAHEVGENASGRDNPLIADMQALGQPNGLPMRPILDIGVAARMAWEIWQARAER